MRKSFQVASAAQADMPVEFELNWQLPDGTLGSPEIFTAYPGRIPGATLLSLANMMVDQNSVAMFELFRAALGDDFARFETLIRDPSRHVTAETLAEIVSWLGEEASGRPTPPSSP